MYQQPYSLQELQEYLPAYYRLSMAEYRYRVLQAEWAARGLHRNHPFTSRKLQGIVRSVERYRAQWIAQGRFYDHSAPAQAARGYKSGQARRARVRERDAEIPDRMGRGWSQRRIARQYGLTRGLCAMFCGGCSAVFIHQAEG